MPTTANNQFRIFDPGGAVRILSYPTGSIAPRAYRASAPKVSGEVALPEGTPLELTADHLRTMLGCDAEANINSFSFKFSITKQSPLCFLR